MYENRQSAQWAHCCSVVEVDAPVDAGYFVLGIDVMMVETVERIVSRIYNIWSVAPW